MKFKILFSRFYVLQTVAESTQRLYVEPGYPDVIKHMREQMDRIDKMLDSPRIDVNQISQNLQQIVPYAIEMANLTDHAEAK